MRPFAFRLAGVLAVWQRREDAALANLQRQQAATHVAQTRLADNERQREEAMANLARAVAGAANGEDPGWHRNWITHLAMRREADRDEVARCAANEAAAKTAWQRSRRDRRVIERLRERAQARHAVDARRHDMKVMDELAGMATGRRERQAW
jgi:flagellar export protein FliJ